MYNILKLEYILYIYYSINKIVFIDTYNCFIEIYNFYMSYELYKM